MYASIDFTSKTELRRAIQQARQSWPTAQPWEWRRSPAEP
jgi:hypothetical protein